MVKILIGLFILVIGFVTVVIIHPEVYLPHQRITISVPFDKDDPPITLIPMGETINHPKPQVPNGHPGIDFSWGNHNAMILSSSDGEVTSIRLGSSNPGKWDIEVQSGVYILRYKELKDYNHNLHPGSKVKKGDLIGTTGKEGEISMDAGGIHWEFASSSFILDRLCPMNYFDPESRRIMEEIWAKTPEDANSNMKKQFPYICSGDYYGKEEK